MPTWKKITLEGSFSAVSTATIARVGSFLASLHYVCKKSKSHSYALCRWKKLEVLEEPIFKSFFAKFAKFLKTYFVKFWVWSGAKACKFCRSRKTWKNEYLVAIRSCRYSRERALQSDHTRNASFGQLAAQSWCSERDSSPNELSTVRSRLYRQLR